MSITDRELILGAARVAGYVIQEGVDLIFLGTDFPESSVRYGQIRYAVWDPLENNDDALSLMCDMELKVQVDPSAAYVSDDLAVAYPEMRHTTITAIDYKTDKQAMTRHAIVHHCYHLSLKLANNT